MKIKRFAASVVALMMCVSMFSTTAFAFAEEPKESTEPAKAVEEPKETPPKPMKPLTPDGNMDLVDDEGSTTGAGKQFITVTTKKGNFFYIIVDRDDNGAETVHFLNQVDEADLMKLLDDEEAAQFAPIVQEPEPTPDKEEAEQVPEEKPEEPEPEPKKPNMIPAMATVLALAAGGGFFAFKKIKEKKKAQEQAKPDPDADYSDDEDYGIVDDEADDTDYSDENEDDNEPV